MTDSKQEGTARRRAYGSGSIVETNGRYYGSWYAGGQKVKKVLGPVRSTGRTDGLTKTMAERKLRELMGERKASSIDERLTVSEVGERFLERKRALGLGPNTLETYESYLRVHISPTLGDRPIAKLAKDDVRAFMSRCSKAGQSAKSTKNYLGLLHGICEFAVRENWATTNPCKLVEKPRARKLQEIHFLDREQLNRFLLEGPEPTPLGRLDALSYYTAAMTGLRQGELLGLRWIDIDWAAGRIRVRQAYSRGRLGPPKSRSSVRSVPLADALAAELDRHCKQTLWTADSDLVFAHPETGGPMDRSRLLKRFKAAVVRAGVGQFKPATDQGGKVIMSEDDNPVMRPVLTFHDLRHTFGTQMAAAGIPLRTIQAWMGHEDIKTTMIYADYMPAANEAQLIGQAMHGILPVGGSNSGSILRASERVSEVPSPVG